MPEIQPCARCKKQIDLMRESIVDGLCCNCTKSDDPSIPPWPDHMMLSVEPYIVWRVNQALAAALPKVEFQSMEDLKDGK